MPSLLRSARLPERVQVDDRARRCGGGLLRFARRRSTAIVHAWRDALAAIGADVRVVRSGQLRGGRRAPRAYSSCRRRRASRSTRARPSRPRAAAGRGLVITGMTGAFDAGCRPLGYGLVIGVTGASRAEVLNSPDGVLYFLSNTLKRVL